jgi:hypothetical protein
VTLNNDDVNFSVYFGFMLIVAACKRLCSYKSFEV